MRPRLAATAERRPVLWRRLLAPSLTVAVRVSRDAVGIQAGSLTYGAFLSLPPLLLILMSIAGALLRSHPQASEDLVTAVTNVVPGPRPGDQRERRAEERAAAGDRVGRGWSR